MGCRSGVYATAAVTDGAGVGDGVVVGVAGVGVGLEAAGAGVQFLGSDGPSGTPLEQAAIVIADIRNVTNSATLHFMTCQWWKTLTGMRSPVETMAAAKPLSAE